MPGQCRGRLARREGQRALGPMMLGSAHERCAAAGDTSRHVGCSSSVTAVAAQTDDLQVRGKTPSTNMTSPESSIDGQSLGPGLGGGVVGEQVRRAAAPREATVAGAPGRGELPDIPWRQWRLARWLTGDQRHGAVIILGRGVFFLTGFWSKPSRAHQQGPWPHQRSRTTFWRIEGLFDWSRGPKTAYTAIRSDLHQREKRMLALHICSIRACCARVARGGTGCTRARMTIASICTTMRY